MINMVVKTHRGLPEGHDYEDNSSDNFPDDPSNNAAVVVVPTNSNSSDHSSSSSNSNSNSSDHNSSSSSNIHTNNNYNSNSSSNHSSSSNSNIHSNIRSNNDRNSNNSSSSFHLKQHRNQDNLPLSPYDTNVSLNSHYNNNNHNNIRTNVSRTKVPQHNNSNNDRHLIVTSQPAPKLVSPQNGVASSVSSQRNYSQAHRNHKPRAVHPKLDDRARGILVKEKCTKLKQLLDQQYNIESKDGRVSFQASMSDIIQNLRSKLYEKRVSVMKGGIRLVGSGACYVISDMRDREMNDLDFSFYIMDGTRFLDILEIEEDVICELLEERAGIKLTRREVYDYFFLDSVKVESHASGRRESWSLITFGQKGNRTIDIKFVFKSKRSYVFSADSFEVILDSLFPMPKPVHTKEQQDPRIVVESLYGDYPEALYHLKQNFLCTIHPEEIRRGIFRYCYELAKGKRPLNDREREVMDKVFTEGFLAEEHNMQFEEVLAKFLQKHTSNAQSFLEQLAATLSRSATNYDLQKYLQIIDKYRLSSPKTEIISKSISQPSDPSLLSQIKD